MEVGKISKGLMMQWPGHHGKEFGCYPEGNREPH
jgi:hypothetical protein